MPDPEATGGRRDYDPGSIDAELRLLVNNEIRDTRHMLRNEVSALGAKVEAMQLVSSQEHADVKATLRALTSSVAEIKATIGTLQPQVTALQTADAVDHATARAIGKLRRQAIGTALALGTLIIGAAAAIAAYIH